MVPESLRQINPGGLIITFKSLITEAEEVLTTPSQINQPNTNYQGTEHAQVGFPGDCCIWVTINHKNGRAAVKNDR